MHLDIGLSLFKLKTFPTEKTQESYFFREAKMKDRQHTDQIDEGPRPKKIKLEQSSDYDKADQISAADYILAKRTKESISHRIIEKRRRDRINRCLNELSRLVPSTSNRKGKLEKAEILQQAVEHLRQLQSCRQHSLGSQIEIKQEKVDDLENADARQNTSVECNSGVSDYQTKKENIDERSPSWLRNVNHLPTWVCTRTDREFEKDEMKSSRPDFCDNAHHSMLGVKPSYPQDPKVDPDTATVVDGPKLAEDAVAVSANKMPRVPLESTCQLSKSRENLNTDKGLSVHNSWKLPLKKRDCVHAVKFQVEEFHEQTGNGECKENSKGHENRHRYSAGHKGRINCDPTSNGKSSVPRADNLNTAVIIEVKSPSGETRKADAEKTMASRRASAGYAYVSSIHPALAAGVPVFALHPSGSGFVPLTINPMQLASAIANSTEFAPVNDMALIQQGMQIPDIPLPLSTGMTIQQPLLPCTVEAHLPNMPFYGTQYYPSPLLSATLSAPSSVVGSNSSISSLSSLSSMASYPSISSRVSAQAPWQGPPSNRPISH